MPLADSRVEETLDTPLAESSINTLRFLAVDAVQQAKSGHPGMPMGAAAMAYVLWHHHLRHNPADPAWPDRDRFVLSAGHGSMLLYGLLHLTGYDLPMSELKAFRQWGSQTPGHPENFHTVGIETTTGPLGQGFANAIGMAVAERYLAAEFNREGFTVVDHHTYAIASDGDLMEGISHEAASLAGHLGLGKFICLYDDNKITIDGSTDLAFTEDVGARFEAYGWQVIRVENGNDLAALDAALDAAKSDPERPSLLMVRTIIGFGSPSKQDTADAHGAPLGPEEVLRTKENLGWPQEPTFFVPDDVADHMDATASGQSRQADWSRLFEAYSEKYPEEAERFTTWLAGGFEEGWEASLPDFAAGEKMATRKASGKVLEAIGPKLRNVIGGSADLSGSNNTFISGRGAHTKDNPGGGYFHFGVREHAMASMCNGITLHGGLRPYCGTFLIFSDYMRPAVRLSALMGTPVVYVFTHDSIGLGEDGPTHQPVEHLMALRAIPNLTVIRPADARETAEAWRSALHRTDGPTALALTRQGLPALDRSQVPEGDGVHRGAYILSDDGGTPDLILMASGSEVQLAVGAAEMLRADGRRVRVVSMPSWALFEAQDDAYREAVLPPSVTRRVAVEAGITMGWGRYVGTQGTVVGLDRFGASAPAEVLFEQFGFTAENVAEKARSLFG